MFRTYDPHEDRLVAVKAFKLDVPPQTVVRLADALRRLVDRPAIPGAPIRVLDAGLEGTRAFLAMEYAPGESIDVAWRQQLPVPIERALPVLSLVADALDAGWAQGIGHGALHPRDLFVISGADEIRLTGLGIVQAIESIGEKAPVRRPYAAPERVALQPWGPAADVYSLGVIAHELLAGRRPSGADQDGILAPGLSPEARVRVRRVLASALADRPEDRFASASALVAALGAAARGELVDLPVPRVAVSAPPVEIAPVDADGPADLAEFAPESPSDAPEPESPRPDPPQSEAVVVEAAEAAEALRPDVSADAEAPRPADAALESVTRAVITARPSGAARLRAARFAQCLSSRFGTRTRSSRPRPGHRFRGPPCWRPRWPGSSSAALPDIA